jgi:hypothetical protein
MKKVLFFSVICFATCALFAQFVAPPQKIRYQAVVRDDKGNPVPKESIVRIVVSIINSSDQVVYREGHKLNPNQFGLVSFYIGYPEETLVGSFDMIEWEKGPYFVRLEMEINGTGYTNMINNPQNFLIYRLLLRNQRHTLF